MRYADLLLLLMQAYQSGVDAPTDASKADQEERAARAVGAIANRAIEDGKL
jgi:hypothetical protein